MPRAVDRSNARGRSAPDGRNLTLDRSRKARSLPDRSDRDPAPAALRSALVRAQTRSARAPERREPFSCRPVDGDPRAPAAVGRARGRLASPGYRRRIARNSNSIRPPTPALSNSDRPGVRLLSPPRGEQTPGFAESGARSEGSCGRAAAPRPAEPDRAQMLTGVRTPRFIGRQLSLQRLSCRNARDTRP